MYIIKIVKMNTFMQGYVFRPFLPREDKEGGLHDKREGKRERRKREKEKMGGGGGSGSSQKSPYPKKLRW